MSCERYYRTMFFDNDASLHTEPCCYAYMYAMMWRGLIK